MITRNSFVAFGLSLAHMLLLLFVGCGMVWAQNPGLSLPASASSARFDRLPLSFEANQGQTDPRVGFLSHGDGYNLYLTGEEAVVVMKRPTGPPPTPFNGQALPRTDDQRVPSVVRMALVGAVAGVHGIGIDRLPGYSNYILGRDTSNWRTHVAHFGQVRYAGIYPGVDLVYYGQGRYLEHDFVVAPGASANSISLAIRGGSLRVDQAGDLSISTPEGDLVMQKPVAYQRGLGGRHQPVEARFEVVGEQVRFALGAYDHRRELVIDPVIRFSTYLGGSAEDRAAGVAVDKSGNVYVAGSTESADFPTVHSIFPFVGTCATCHDLFVTKMNSTGKALIYSTYIGGSADDFGISIAVDSSGNAFVVGSTTSTDFPTTAGAFQRVYGGSGTGSTGLGGDGFVLKVNAGGTALTYSTYIGGSSEESAVRVVVDSTGNAYISGSTASSNFPVSAGAFRTTCPVKTFYGSCYAAFVAKVNSTGSALTYSTYLTDTDTAVGYADTALALALDSSGHAYVGGEMGPGFPTTAGAFQTTCTTSGTCGNWVQGFVAKMNPTGTALVYGTYLGSTGGGGPSEVAGIALDSTGAAYVTGLFAKSTAADFPITAGVIQPTYGGGSGCFSFGCGDDFVSKLNSSGSALVYSTYLGGSGDESPLNIAVDSQKNAYVETMTTSTNFPLTNATQSVYGGGSSDGAVTELNSGATALLYSSYLGGNGSDIVRGLSVDASGNMYLVGRTNSTNFPVTTGAFQTKCGTDGTCNGGLLDAFVTKISPSADLSVVNSAPATVHSGATLTYTITTSSAGPDTALNATITDSIPTGTTFKSVTVASGVTCTKPAIGGTGNVVCTVPLLKNANSTVETLVVNVTALIGSTITDKATVSFGGSDPKSSNNSSTATTTVN